MLSEENLKFMIVKHLMTVMTKEMIRKKMRERFYLISIRHIYLIHGDELKRKWREYEEEVVP